MTLATNWVDNIGMFVNAAYLNQLGSEVNANTYAKPLSGTRSAMPAAAASNNGAVYYCTDSDAIYQSNGSAWTKIRVGGGAISAALADPPATGWTGVNMPAGGSFAADGDSMLLTFPSSGANDNVGYQYRTYPASPFTLITCIEPLVLGAIGASTLAWAGIGISDGTKLALFGPANLSVSGYTDGWNALGYTYGSVTTPGTSYGNLSLPRCGGMPKWWKFVDDGTNRKVSFSVNGIDWVPLASETRTTFLTPTRIGIFGNNYSGKTILARVRSWSGVA